MSSHSVLLINGPNLNMLGTREVDTYGKQTLIDIERDCVAYADSLGITLHCVQSNSEGKLIDAIHHSLQENFTGIIINAGAYSHSSIALGDAIRSVDIPVIEVHMSNVYQREEFRHHSYIASNAVGTISGFGAKSYLLGIEAMAHIIKNK